MFFIMAKLSLAQTSDTLIVNFAFDKYDLTPAATARLDAFAGKISQLQVGSIQLSGYCDSKGSNAYNDALSLKRVNTVKAYLQKNKNVTAASFTAKGFGENGLLNSDATDEEGFQNRRVEIIVSIKQQPVIAPVPEVKKETKSLTKMMEDTTVKKGSVITLPNFQFYNNSDVLLPQSQPTLRELLDIMIKNPKLRISIEGHICCVISDKDIPYTQVPNFRISLIRAKMVYDHLINNGIAASRMEYKGFGSSQPLYPIPEKTEEEKIANRRVEIRIIEK